MEQSSKIIEVLYKKWLDQTASVEEKNRLLELISTKENKDILHDLMKKEWDELEMQNPATPDYTESEIRKILAKHPGVPQEPAITRIFNRKYIGWAAAVLIVLIGTFQFLRTGKNENNPVAQLAAMAPLSLNNDINPGGAGAVLTLANGDKIMLDSTGNGVVANESGVEFLLQNGNLLCNQKENLSADNTNYNILTTPRGKRFELTLPDKTKVWLNAGSSIKFPMAFTGSERNVEITGEAFFDVAKNKQMPFKVRFKQLEVEVLGTQFNINAYEDENTINTTLLEGSLRLKNNNGKVLLSPGQQGKAQKSAAGLEVIKNVDTERVVAWKKGVFDFDNASLPEVMRQISRWYNVDVVYMGNVPSARFGGKMERSLTLSQALKAFDIMGVNLMLKDRKLYIK